MADVSISLDVTSKLDLTQLEDAIDNNLPEMASILYDYSYSACPVDTGYMRSTISTDIDTDQNRVTLKVGANYAGYTEYRTGWLSKAIQEAGRECVRQLGGSL